MLKKLVLIAASSLIVSGCASSPIMLANASPAELATARDSDLVAACAVNRDAGIMEELKRRGLLDDADLAGIAARRFFIGMNEAAVQCTMPLAAQYQRSKMVMTTANGTLTRYIVPAGFWSATRLVVDIVDGKVTQFGEVTL